MGSRGVRQSRGVREYIALAFLMVVVIHSAISAPLCFSYLAFYFSSPNHPLQTSFCCIQTKKASGVEVLFASRPPLSLSFAHRFRIVSTASGLSKLQQNSNDIPSFGLRQGCELASKLCVYV